MDPILFLFLCLGAAIGIFIGWRVNRKKRIKSNKSNHALSEYEKQQRAGHARRLMEQLPSCGWAELLDLRKRHKEMTFQGYADAFAYTYSFTEDSCKGELSWLGLKSDGSPQCWLEVVDKEIQQRIEELLRAGNMDEVKNLAMTRDLIQAWDAIGTTTEGVAWLEKGLHSTNARQRARCHRTLYDGE